MAGWTGRDLIVALFRELRRRSVFRVAAAYVVASWIVVQVVSALNSPLSLPEWFERVVIVLLAIGLPIAIVLAWAFELTPDGIKLTSSAETGDAPPSGSKVDLALVAALVAVAAATLWTSRAPDGPGTGSQPAFTGAPSIAVLPFADMSPAGDQAYFGDGIAEELLNELARLDGLQVAGRTSSFAYRDSQLGNQAIGEALNVATVLEGSVRKDGNRLRVTAQLIDVGNGFHLWSETYDREMTDIFVIQENIAREVAGALGVQLGVGGVNSFAGAGTTNFDAYEAYLRAADDGASIGSMERERLLRRAIELDPEYAAAWGLLGLTNAARMWVSQPEDAPALLQAALPALQRAVELDPQSGFAWSMLGTIQYPSHDWIGAQQSYERAVSLLRSHTTLRNVANMYMRAGRMTSSQAFYEESTQVEPYFGERNSLRFSSLIALRRFDAARDLIALSPSLNHLNVEIYLVLSDGDRQALREMLQQAEMLTDLDAGFANRVLAVFDDREALLAHLRSEFADDSLRWPAKYHFIAMLAAYFDEPELAMEALAAEIRFTPARQGATWHPVMSDVRKLPQFKDLMREINLVEYWREYGWPDFCRPVGDDDFVCE